MSLVRIIVPAIIIISSFLILATSAQQQQPHHRRLAHDLTNKKAFSLSHAFLAAHNYVRVHNGARPLIWDKKLALYARRWAKRRRFDCELIHSRGPYGENIFWGGRNHWTPAEIVYKWAEEYKYFDAHKNECQQDQMCGHYTQILWRDTVRVGCAMVKCYTGGLFAVCSYDPPGNLENEGPFGIPSIGESSPLVPFLDFSKFLPPIPLL